MTASNIVGVDPHRKTFTATVLDSLFLTTGQKAYAFEKAFEEYLGVPAVVCTAHATASLHIAMLAAAISALFLLDLAAIHLGADERSRRDTRRPR